MSTLKNIACECVMTDESGNEFAAKLFIPEAETEGMVGSKNKEGEYNGEINLKIKTFKITVEDGKNEEDVKPQRWTIK